MSFLKKILMSRGV